MRFLKLLYPGLDALLMHFVFCPSPSQVIAAIDAGDTAAIHYLLMPLPSWLSKGRSKKILRAAESNAKLREKIEASSGTLARNKLISLP